MHPLHKGGADGTRITKQYNFYVFFCLQFYVLSQLRNTSGTRESTLQEHGKCLKGFMEPENWTTTHTLQSNNHAAEFVSEGVGGGQAQPR